MFRVPTFLKGPNGALLLNDLSGSVRGGVGVPPSQGFNIPVGTTNAMGASSPIILESPTDSWVDIQALIGFFSSGTASDVQKRALVQINDILTTERQLMNRPVPAQHVFGSPGNPLFFDPHSEGLLLQDLQTLTLNFFNPSTAGAGTFSFQLPWIQYQTASRRTAEVSRYLDALTQRRRKICPYWLAPIQNITPSGQPGVSLSANGSGVLTFENVTNCDLIVTEIIATAISSGVAGDVNELATFQMQDQRSSRNLQNQAVSLNCFSGDAQFPYVLPVPLVIENNGLVSVNVTNLVTDATTDVLLTLFGVKVQGDRL